MNEEEEEDNPPKIMKMSDDDDVNNKTSSQQVSGENYEYYDPDKKLTRLNEAAGGIFSFIYKEMKKEKHEYLDKLYDAQNNNLEESVVEIGQKLFGNGHTPSAILVRPQFKQIFQLVLNKFKSKSNNVVLGGTFGVGKSVFAFLAVLAFALRENKVVCYDYDACKMIVVGKHAVKESFDVLTMCLMIHRYHLTNVKRGEVYLIKKIEDSGIWHSLLTYDKIVHVQDFDHDSTMYVNLNGCSRSLILAKPNPKQLAPLRSVGYSTLYLPVWSEEEIMVASRRIFKKQNQEEMKNRFKKFGGIPRLLLENPPNKMDDILRAQIAHFELSGLRMFQNQLYYIETESHHNMYAFAHIAPTNGYEDGTVKIASKQIEQLLAERFVSDWSFNVNELSSLVKDKPQLARFCDFVLEEYFHKFLGGAKDGVELEIGRLERTTIKNKVKLVNKKFPRFLRTIRLEEPVQLTAILGGDYVRPPKQLDSKPLFDSFAIMDYSFFNEKKKGKCIAVFLITLSESREEVSGLVLKNIQEKVKQFNDDKLLPIVLVFALKWHTDIQTLQVITGDDAKSIEQYIITIPGFNALVNP